MSSQSAAAEYSDYYGRDYSNLRKKIHQKISSNALISTNQISPPSQPPYQKKDLLNTESSSLSHVEEGVVWTGTLEKKSTVKRRKKLKSLALYIPLHKERSFRPSFADHLRLITDNVSSITKSLSDENSLSSTTFYSQEGNNKSVAVLKTMPASFFSVGTLACKFPSPVHFYATHCTYLFYPMYENAEIDMIMYYKDMHQIHFTHRNLRFRILKELKHFKKDYTVENAQHMVSIQFAGTMNEEDFCKIKNRLATK